jgi:PAS domain S-box-containing protein
VDYLSFLPPDGAAAAAVRARDWAATPVGAPEGWPDALRLWIANMLGSSEAMFLAWGEDLTFFFNDGYAPFLGARAAGGMGMAFPDLWPDVWPDVAPIVERALAGEASRHENFHLTMTRNGFPEETWWTFTYNPLYDEAGTVRGMWCAATEVTARVLAERHRAAERGRLSAMFEKAPGFHGPP